MSVRILLACCRRQLCVIKGGGGSSLCRSAALLSVVLSCLSCLRCGPALLVRASEASQSCVRQHATVPGTSAGGGGGGGRLLMDSGVVCVRAKRAPSTDVTTHRQKSKYLLTKSKYLLT